MSWETTIRTGSHEGDQQALAQCDAQARGQGLTLRTTQLAGGGFHVAAVSAANPYSAPPPAYAQNAYGAPPPAYAQNPYAAPAPPAPAPYGGYGGPAPSPYAQYNPQAGGAHCDQCGVQGPVKQATFMQNIGMLVIRFPKTRQGRMCRRCIDESFWSFTLVTGFLGWWGMISFVYSLISIPTNIINYLSALKLPEPPREAYDRAGIPTVAWPGWRIATLLLGLFGGLFSLVWTAAIVSVLVESAQNEGLDPGGVVIMGVFVVLAWLIPAGMLLGALKRPRIAAA
jgi:hypothetical protein